MSDSKVFDTLTDFHLHNANQHYHIWLNQLVAILDQLSTIDINESYELLDNLFSEERSAQLFHFLCDKTHVDWQQLASRCQTITNKHLSPKLLLHILCLPIPYVAEKLQIDQYRVAQLLDELHKSFTIDNPILWLKNLLDQILKHEMVNEKQKHEELLGLAVVNQAQDTAEERRIRERILHPHLLEKPE